MYARKAVYNKIVRLFLERVVGKTLMQVQQVHTPFLIDYGGEPYPIRSRAWAAWNHSIGCDGEPFRLGTKNGPAEVSVQKSTKGA